MSGKVKYERYKVIIWGRKVTLNSKGSNVAIIQIKQFQLISSLRRFIKN